MTIQEARKIGYNVERGNYSETSDDRRDRWYIQKIGDITDHRGRGFATRQEALDLIEEIVGLLNRS